MKVVVLLSAYKGAPWIRQQIESILSQLPPEGRLVVRDDGSPDETVLRVREIHDPRLTLVEGTNVGFVRSFLGLVANAPPDADMVMLSDQDDVWLPNKVQRAWEVIAASGAVPTLYCSRLRLVDSKLHPLGLSPLWARAPSFQNALAENIVTGCTAALNPSAVDLLRDNGDAGLIHFHDWWLYLVVSAFGRVVFDPEPTILYRQHGNNAIGMGQGLGRYATILRFIRKHDWVHIMFNQIANFRSVHGSRLPAHQRRVLDALFAPDDWKSVARLLAQPCRLRQTVAGDVLFRLLLLRNILGRRGLVGR